MRIVILSLAFFFNSILGYSQHQIKEGYEITAQIRPYKSGYYFLAYHFGNKQFLIDSAKLDANGIAVFKGDKKLQGGIYMIVFPEKNGWVECIVDKQQYFKIEADTSNIANTTTFTGSPDNVLFNDYQKKAYEIGNKIASIRKIMGEKPNDTTASEKNAQIAQLGKEIQDYRENLQKKHPELLLSSIFKLLSEPTVPPGSEHPGGKYDSGYAYQFYKNHFWDGISFADERLIRTPVLQGRFDRYYDQVLPQSPDSIKLYADRMLEESKPSEEMFKFILSSLTEKYVNPKYMGQDAIFVHLFEKYFLTGQADSWMNEKYKKFVFDRGYSLMANVIGAKAPELPMIDTAGKKFSLYSIQAPFTVICFWDPTCGHCKEDVPKIDSIFQKKWKANGVSLIGVMTDGGKENWIKFIKDNNLKGWRHIYQTDETKEAILKSNKPGYRQLYDVYQTPTIYLLDKDKNIIAKKITYQQVDEFMDIKRKSKN
jgi:hypothetical protein